MTGLSVDTLRAWERRYGVVKPARADRGRSYDDSDVRRLTLLRRVVENGYAIGQIAALPDAELQKLAQRRGAFAAAVDDSAAAARPAHVDAVFAAVQLFDSPRLSEELGRLASLLSPAEFVHQVALPLMREVGERWHSGLMQTAHEHLVTENIRNLMGAMARLNRPAEGQVKMLATTPADELHEVGVLAGALLAGARGFHVTCLGPNLPADEILFAAQRTAPQVVLLGLTSPEPLPNTRETVRAVAAGLEPHTELWLAGTGAVRLMPLDRLSARQGVYLVEDFQALERHLTRIQSTIRKSS